MLLVYNSQDPESHAIASVYLDLHPNVHTCDLDVPYTTDYQLEPPDCGITKKYITPCKFDELFLDSAGPFQSCLATLNPKPLCIVTARGLPVAISDTTSPTATPCGGFFGDLQPCHGMYASVDGVLMRIGLPQPGGAAVGEGVLSTAYDLIANPYYTDDTPYIVSEFHEFLSAACVSTNGVVCRGKMFLVSRLDAGPGTFDWDDDNDIDNIDGVIAVLRHGEFPQVNQYAVSALFDTDGELSGSAENETVGACIAMWDDLWCSLHESTYEFIHGPDDGCFDEETDGLYAQWPIIAMQTFGRNHILTTDWCDPADPPELETILPAYVWNYRPHRLGVFLSVESFNGWQLRRRVRRASVAGPGSGVVPSRREFRRGEHLRADVGPHRRCARAVSQFLQPATLLGRGVHGFT